jgi:hypothetical protein
MNSFPIAVDNCASYIMTNDESDFINSPVTVHKNILGIGATKAVKQGTVRWLIQDDHGAVEFFTILNTFYVPDLPIRLLSSQHWSQANAHLDAHSDTDAHRITPEWGDRRILLSNGIQQGEACAPSTNRAPTRGTVLHGGAPDTAQQ